MFECIFDQINVTLLSQETSSQTKYFQPQTFEIVYI